MSGIIRVYKRDEEGTLQFREAWIDEEFNEFVMNHGVVGHQSKTEETDAADAEAAERLMDAFAGQCAEDGYAEIPEEEQFWVVAQYALKTKDGTTRDRYLEEKAKDALISHLAWRGPRDRGPLANSPTPSSTSSPYPGRQQDRQRHQGLHPWRGPGLHQAEHWRRSRSARTSFKLKHSPKPANSFTL